MNSRRSASDAQGSASFDTYENREAAGLYEAYRLAGGLEFLMVMMLTVLTAAIVVFTIRREQAEERQARERPPD